MLNHLTNKIQKLRYVPTGEKSFSAIAERKGEIAFKKATNSVVNSVEDAFQKTVTVDQQRCDVDRKLGSVNYYEPSLSQKFTGIIYDTIVATALGLVVPPAAVFGIFAAEKALNPRSDGFVFATLRKLGAHVPYSSNLSAQYSTDSERFRATRTSPELGYENFSRKTIGEHTVYQSGLSWGSSTEYGSYVALDKNGKLAHTSIEHYPIPQGQNSAEALANSESEIYEDTKGAKEQLYHVFRAERKLKRANNKARDLDPSPTRAVIEKRKSFGEARFDQSGNVTKAKYCFQVRNSGVTFELDRSEERKLRLTRYWSDGQVKELTFTTDDSGKIREDLPYQVRQGQTEVKPITKAAEITHGNPQIHFSTKISAAAVGGASGFTLALVNKEEVVDGQWTATEDSPVRRLTTENVDLFPLDGRFTPAGAEQDVKEGTHVANYAGLKENPKLIPGDVAFTTLSSGSWETHDGETLQQAAERVKRYEETHGKHDGEFSLNVALRADPTRLENKALVMIPTCQFESGEFRSDDVIVPKHVIAISNTYHENHTKYGLVANADPNEFYRQALDFKGR